MRCWLSCCPGSGLPFAGPCGAWCQGSCPAGSAIAECCRATHGLGSWRVADRAFCGQIRGQWGVQSASPLVGGTPGPVGRVVLQLRHRFYFNRRAEQHGAMATNGVHRGRLPFVFRHRCIDRQLTGGSRLRLVTVALWMLTRAAELYAQGRSLRQIVPSWAFPGLSRSSLQRRHSLQRPVAHPRRP
jgi:hypothetical protein